MKSLLIVALFVVVGVFYFCQFETPFTSPAKEVNEPLTVTYDNLEEILATPERVVLLDFWTPWCEPSVLNGSSLTELAKELANQVVIGRVNLDDYKMIGEDFGIQRLPTLIYLVNGVIMKRTVGLIGKKKIQEEINEVSRHTTPL